MMHLDFTTLARQARGMLPCGVLALLALCLLWLGPAPASAQSYVYDSQGRLSHVDYPGGSSVFYSYDDQGNILRTATGNGGLTGWWWDASVPGTGVALEVQGKRLYLAWYTYDGEGNPVWYAALMDQTGNLAYTGTLKRYQGYPLGSSPTAISTVETGSVALSFSGALTTSTCAMAWTLDGAGGTSGQLNLTKYLNDLDPGARDPRNLHGWWWDPAYPGTGVFIEASSNTLYMAWYQYGAGGLARWWVAGGFLDVNGFPPTFTTYSAQLTQFNGGTPPGGAVSTATATDQGKVRFTMNDDATIEMLYDGVTYNLVHYPFMDAMF